MKRRSVLAVLAVVCMLFSMSASAQAKVHRVVFAVTSPEEADWHLTMGNIRNLISGLAPDTVEVEVVSYGPGLHMVRKPSVVDEDIQALIAKHVKFVACENAMRAQKVTKDDLLTGVGTVPAGIVEVVTKQEQGWTYIKAGR
jgi:intracellular sulfur oxidation DsrE/DsrF family protein